jgi:hypothetical protein
MRGRTCLPVVALLLLAGTATAEPTYPPRLPGGKAIATLSGPELLEPTAPLKDGVKIAHEAPTVDFLFYPGQTYPGHPWSVWGDGTAVEGKYYSAIGDHKAPQGNAFVYEYDTGTRKLRRIVDVQKVLKMPAGHYTPGKIHSRIDLGSDGWLYFSTHRGSTRVTTDEYHYKGDWILRHNPKTGKTEIVAHAPLPKQCLPASVLDPDRLIFYAGTADGDRTVKRVQFLAYDVKKHKVLYSDDHGPKRYLIFARSTGKVYFHGEAGTPGRAAGARKLVRFDPDKPGPPVPIDAEVGLRSATAETPQGFVYTIDGDALWEFNTKSEKARLLGPAAVGTQTYTTSIDADPKTGRYLYYVPGAHGGGEKDGSPLVQYDVKTRTRKVICFLHPILYEKFGYIPQGTFGSAVSPAGDKVFITWNGNTGTAKEDLGRRIRFNTCALTVVHIPASERKP